LGGHSAVKATFNQSLTEKLSFKLVQFPQCRPRGYWGLLWTTS